MTTNPLTVAIVIPTYNGSAFVADAIRSVSDQTRRPDELIIVDDCSTDDTLARIEQVRTTVTCPVRVISLPTNSGGPARPMNEGIRASRADLIAVLDQDDVFLPDRVEALATALESRPDVSLALGWGQTYEKPARLLQPPAVIRGLQAIGQPDRGELLIAGIDMLRLLVTHAGIETGFPGFMFRRGDWERKGGLDETLRISADYDLQCWLSSVGRVAVVPRPLYLRRHHDNNLSWVAGFHAFLDVGRLILRYAEVAGASQGPSFYRYLARHYVRSLLALGWARRHREAYRRLITTGRHGWSFEHLAAFAKITYTWLAWRVFGKQFTVPYEKISQFTQVLDDLQRLCDKGLAAHPGGTAAGQERPRNAPKTEE